MKEVDSLIVVAAIAIFMAGVVVGMVLMALAAAAKRKRVLRFMPFRSKTRKGVKE